MTLEKITLEKLEREPLSSEEKQFLKELLRRVPGTSLWKVDGVLKVKGIRLKPNRADR